MHIAALLVMAHEGFVYGLDADDALKLNSASERNAQEAQSPPRETRKTRRVHRRFNNGEPRYSAKPMDPGP